MMFIYIYIYIYIYNIEHRDLETRKTRNDFSVQVRNFLLLLSLKVFRHEERGVQSFYSGFFISPPPSPHLVRHLPKASASKRKSTLLVRCLVSTLLTDFLKISPNPPRASGAWRHSHSETPFPISSYYDISEWHVHFARAHAREHLR